ncbi:hypothetical protein ACFCW2_02535 [Qipengyuania sp. DSG2-2]|uniref:hypothetical protein n=1 Tax=Qipengyuania sp. DGS2-2 TaxID=3349631 RepID=UPI0036D346D1
MMSIQNCTQPPSSRDKRIRRALLGGTLSVLCLSLALTSPLRAQDDPQIEQSADGEQAQRSSTPIEIAVNGALTAATNDEFVEYFKALSGDIAIRERNAPIIEMMSTEGPKVDGWEQQGVDIIAELQAAGDGQIPALLRDTRADSNAVGDPSGLARADFSGFTSYILQPEPDAQSTERAFFSVLPGVWLQTVQEVAGRGNARCVTGDLGVVLHVKRPHTQWSPDELLFYAGFVAFLDQIGEKNLCFVHDRGDGGAYTAAAYLLDGTSLPAFTESLPVSVIMDAKKLQPMISGE